MNLLLPASANWSDGMPLGIELAANWIRVMQATEIVSEVERSIDFLTSKQRDIPDRHRSIRAVFQSTWAQLPPEEQQIFNQLSIFRNGFTYDAATKITGATPAILLSLIDSSLLTRDNSGRYEIHELLRQFGQFELAVVPEEENKARTAHAAYFAALMERLNPDLYTDAQMRAGILIEDDLENILLAWRWFVDNGAGDGLHQMMDSLHEFCDRSGHCLTGSTAFHQANQALRSMSESNRIRPGLRGALSSYDGLFSQRLGSTDRSAMGDAQLLLDDPYLKPAHLAKIYSEIALTQYFLGQLETTEYLLDAAMRVATTDEDDLGDRNRILQPGSY